LVAYAPHGHWKTTTFLAALRVSGLTAPLVVDGAINGAIFLRYVQQHLVPTLQPGDMVVMDNLNAHKVAGVREAIESVQAQVLYLPPYSPDFNPIEQVFAKFKGRLRSAQERTVEALWRRCGEVLDQFQEAECRNYFRHCDYRYTYVRRALVETRRDRPFFFRGKCACRRIPLPSRPPLGGPGA
jgi:transposase